ncbi:hypothetical protein [Cytobacillus sp. IB215316]|uniref:hypothetical protein n=1 Tax=Cytobacillus sp. IB215316 TaxID=3097354 RepID=UPI002A15964E|nr:hypothetical protein [Cytobacillus sp. IB215316]MDX8363442.1 hypothetical protein [Cytobacillus sp. IB215316]
MVKQAKVLCIKTSINNESEKIDYKEGKEYNAEIIFDDILVESELSEMCLAEIAAKEAVRLGTQEKENGQWDDWFNEHFRFIE